MWMNMEFVNFAPFANNICYQFTPDLAKRLGLDGFV